MVMEETVTITSEVSVERMVDSVLMSGISNSIVDVVMNEIPQELRDNTELQTMATHIQRTEREYNPLYHDWQNSGLFSEFHQTLFRLMWVFYLVGIIACLSLPVGVVALLGLIVVFVIFLYSRWRVLREIKERLFTIRGDLVSQMEQLFDLQERLVKGKMG